MQPTTAFLFMTAGILCIYLEFYRQGWILPGVLGSVLMMVGLSGFARQPLNTVGLVQVLVWLSLSVQAALTGRRLVGGILASISLTMACMAYSVPWLMALASAVPVTFLTIILLAAAIKARKNKTIID